jgi:hypothetical protein
MGVDGKTQQAGAEIEMQAALELTNRTNYAAGTNQTCLELKTENRKLKPTKYPKWATESIGNPE